MKNLLLVTAKSLLVLAVVLMVSPIHAQMSSFGSENSKNNAPQITVSIPEQWKQSVIREENDQAITFSLTNGNSAPVFLFSITEIPDQQWVKVKAQIPDAKMVAHKDGVIYFSQKNTKTKIKGPSADVYQQIYPSLDEWINSVQVN